MTKIVTAIALSIALPAVASAQTAPAPAPNPMDCCAMMKTMGDCAKSMGMAHDGHDMRAGAGPHDGHGMPPSPAAPPAGAEPKPQQPD